MYSISLPLVVLSSRLDVNKNIYKPLVTIIIQVSARLLIVFILSFLLRVPVPLLGSFLVVVVLLVSSIIIMLNFYTVVNLPTLLIKLDLLAFVKPLLAYTNLLVIRSLLNLARTSILFLLLLFIGLLSQFNYVTI